jgi:hypothetical protein
MKYLERYKKFETNIVVQKPFYELNLVEFCRTLNNNKKHLEEYLEPYIKKLNKMNSDINFSTIFEQTLKMILEDILLNKEIKFCVVQHGKKHPKPHREKVKKIWPQFMTNPAFNLYKIAVSRYNFKGVVDIDLSKPVIIYGEPSELEKKALILSAGDKFGI